jgi:hypothetical protein
MQSVLRYAERASQKRRRLIKSDRAGIEFTVLKMGREVSPVERFVILKVQNR